MNHTGHPYIHEKLRSLGERELERRARAHYLAAGSGGSRRSTRHAAASVLRKIADRLEPAANRAGLPQPGR